MFSSNVWGKASSPSDGKRNGFFELDGSGSKALSRSFKDVLAGSLSQGENAPKLTQSVLNGVPAVLISDEDVLKLASPFQFTLVRKFALRRPNLDSVRSFFSNLKLSGFYSVGLLDSKHVAIQLSNDLDYLRVFARRSYFINNCQMRVLKWTPFFDVHEESPIVPIWISFPNLRLYFFNPQVLHALGSVFGRPLQTDQATASRTRPSVARVLVEVDISKKHPKEVWVGSKAFGYLQKVEFEKVSDFCSHCKMHGHALSDCFRLHPELKKISTQNLDKASSPVNGSSSDNVLEKDLSKEEVVTREKVVEKVADDSVLPVNSGNVEPGRVEKKDGNVNPKSPDLFISVDSMLNANVDVLVNQASNLSQDFESENRENYEEGEILPTNSKKGKAVLNLERGSSLPSELGNENEYNKMEDYSSMLYLGEENFTKSHKKKGKKNKEPSSNVQVSNKAQTNSKSSNG
ncbi:hypothetical protein KFK09_004156 [Dendrobium nobile]|uniref:DUF4283 domain-containing protein n=1 Tax=Dendrobium nobile TaxID=94219 RepID=A0A8T3C561_DENNO|nr:hypothetical protein KFK09_004156 [Dendrobium nobile]